jgi:hypothetical protein
MLIPLSIVKFYLKPIRQPFAFNCLEIAFSGGDTALKGIIPLE